LDSAKTLVGNDVAFDGPAIELFEQLRLDVGELHALVVDGDDLNGAVPVVAAEYRVVDQILEVVVGFAPVAQEVGGEAVILGAVLELGESWNQQRKSQNQCGQCELHKSPRLPSLVEVADAVDKLVHSEPLYESYRQDERATTVQR